MKKIIALFLLLCTFAFFLSSCKCYANTFDWEISSVKSKVKFVNGTVASFSRGHHRTEIHPFVVHQGMTYLDIKWNNKVIFKPVDSDEELIGRYKVDYHSDYKTYFTITFENGEKTENGNAATHHLYLDGGDILRAYMTFDFRGVSYSFTAGYDEDTLTEKEYKEGFEEYIAKLRSEDNMLKDGYIELSNGRAKLYADFLYNNDKGYEQLYKTGLIVIPIQITADNELIILNEFKGGDCKFMHYVYSDREYSTTEMRQVYIIYYIDPLS